jgi:hypothetical protein
MLQSAASAAIGGMRQLLRHKNMHASACQRVNP